MIGSLRPTVEDARDFLAFIKDEEQIKQASGYDSTQPGEASLSAAVTEAEDAESDSESVDPADAFSILNETFLDVYEPLCTFAMPKTFEEYQVEALCDFSLFMPVASDATDTSR